MNKLDFMTATLEELQNVPFYFEPGMVFDRLIIVPQQEIHDSGYAMMSYILTRKAEIVGKIGTSSDVLHLDGIGGYGEWDPSKGAPPRTAPIRAWSIDCLPGSKCVSLFCGYNEMKLEDSFDGIGNCLSDISVYGRDKHETTD